MQESVHRQNVLARSMCQGTEEEGLKVSESPEGWKTSTEAMVVIAGHLEEYLM